MAAGPTATTPRASGCWRCCGWSPARWTCRSWRPEGIADGAAIAAVLVAGASAAQLGTAFMLAPEAGTHPAHRAALAGDTPTALTRAFTGRSARGLRNRFLVEHTPDAVAAYPEIHHATSPLRAAARAAGDPGGFNLWAGQAHRLARAAPAGDIVAGLAEEARAALRQAG